MKKNLLRLSFFDMTTCTFKNMSYTIHHFELSTSQSIRFEYSMIVVQRCKVDLRSNAVKE